MHKAADWERGDQGFFPSSARGPLGVTMGKSLYLAFFYQPLSALDGKILGIGTASLWTAPSTTGPQSGLGALGMFVMQIVISEGRIWGVHRLKSPIFSVELILEL